MTESDRTYEERFNPLARRVRRTKRRIAWLAKPLARGTRHILVETRWRLGDEIMALPIYEGLKRRYPFAHVTVWCNFPDLLKSNPFVDVVLPGDADPRRVRCDRYILLHHAPRDVFRLDHYAACASIPTPSSNPRLYYDEWDPPIVSEARGDAPGFIAVCTGASWPTKRWPIGQWQDLCRLLERKNYRIVQIGKDDELIGAGLSLLNRTSVGETACILRAADLIVCCDSGLMHLALAVGTPVVALFGPTVASILIRKGVPCTVLTNGRPCQGCWNISQHMVEPGVCPLNIPTCMEPLAADTVFGFIREVASRGR
jgi:ADP-heptose:LPS heptosyltransferase